MTYKFNFGEGIVFLLGRYEVRNKELRMILLLILDLLYWFKNLQNLFD